MADTNQVALWYVAEDTAGTTPTNSTGWKTMRFTGESLMPKYGTEQSQQIRADRARSDVMQVSATIDGDINYELHGNILDDFGPAATGGGWQAFAQGDVLKIGNTKRSFTVAKIFNDLPSGAKFDRYVGMSVGQLTMALQYGQRATGTLSMMGLGVTEDTVSPVGTGTLAPAPTTMILNGTTDVIEAKIDAVGGLYISQLNLTIGANLRGKTAIGNKFPFANGYGSAMIEGSFQAHFESRIAEDKVRSGAPFALKFTLVAGAKSYEINIPRAFHTSRDGLAANAMDSDIMPTYSFSGSYDTDFQSPIVITRFNTP